MIERRFWKDRAEDLLARRNVLWLEGVRRVGKTVLCRSLDGAVYYDCELPRVRRAVEDPELFFRDQVGGTVVLDEIHRLTNPSEVLKIAADHFPRVRYWRDKRKHEVDFVIQVGRRATPWAVECKARSSMFDPSGLKAFRAEHPEGKNLVVCLDLTEPLNERVGGLEVRFVPFERLDGEL